MCMAEGITSYLTPIIRWERKDSLETAAEREDSEGKGRGRGRRGDGRWRRVRGGGQREKNEGREESEGRGEEEEREGRGKKGEGGKRDGNLILYITTGTTNMINKHTSQESQH